MSMFPIASQTSTGTSGDFVFSSIPQTFTHLQLRIVHRSTSSNTGAFMFLYFNGIYTSPYTQYSWHRLYGDGSSAVSTGSANAARIEFNYPYGQPISTDTAGIFGVTIIDILDYTNTNKNKTVKILSGADKNGSGAVHFTSGMLQSTTAAINQIDIQDAYGNFAAGSRFDLYGIFTSGVTGA